MTKKEPVAPAFGAFLCKLQRDHRPSNDDEYQNLQPFKKGLSNNINQIHAITHFWRSFQKTNSERERFEQEVADCLESDLRHYRIHTGVLKP